MLESKRASNLLIHLQVAGVGEETAELTQTLTGVGRIDQQQTAGDRVGEVQAPDSAPSSIICSRISGLREQLPP